MDVVQDLISRITHVSSLSLGPDDICSGVAVVKQNAPSFVEKCAGVIILVTLSEQETARCDLDCPTQPHLKGARSDLSEKPERLTKTQRYIIKASERVMSSTEGA